MIETKEREIAIGVDTFKHPGGGYSMSIRIDNAHIGITSSGYSSGGHYMNATIFGLCVADMLDLAHSISMAASDIRNKEEHDGKGN